MKRFALFMLALSSLAQAAEIKVGDPAPQIKGLNEQGKEVDFAPLFKNDLVLVYFYPKADTPGCTAQACSLRDSYAKLQKRGVKIYGVSTDSVEAQKAFKEKYHLPFELISDSKQEMAKAFEVPVRLGFASRQAFLIHKGKIAWLDRKAKTKEQADDVLKVLEGIKE